MVKFNVFMKILQFKLPLKSLQPQKKRVNICSKPVIEFNVLMKMLQFKLSLKNLQPQKKRVNVQNQWLSSMCS